MQKKLFIDLFCGSSSFKNAAIESGYEYIGVDWHPYEHASIVKDIELLTHEDFPDLKQYGHIHVHMSPDCKTYSIAAISKHRNGTIPKSEYAIKCDRVNRSAIAFIKSIPGGCSYSIENPRGMLRKMPFMQEFTRYTVWYCQYGDDRAKPTDIWTNLNWTPRPVCHNGNTKCHHAPAPRGSKTGTQGRKGSYERSAIPDLLCRHIVYHLPH